MGTRYKLAAAFVLFCEVASQTGAGRDARVAVNTEKQRTGIHMHELQLACMWQENGHDTWKGVSRKLPLGARVRIRHHVLVFGLPQMSSTCDVCKNVLEHIIEDVCSFMQGLFAFQLLRRGRMGPWASCQGHGLSSEPLKKYGAAAYLTWVAFAKFGPVFGRLAVIFDLAAAARTQKMPASHLGWKQCHARRGLWFQQF